MFVRFCMKLLGSKYLFFHVSFRIFFIFGQACSDPLHSKWVENKIKCWVKTEKTGWERSLRNDVMTHLSVLMRVATSFTLVRRFSSGQFKVCSQNIYCFLTITFGNTTSNTCTLREILSRFQCKLKNDVTDGKYCHRTTIDLRSCLIPSRSFLNLPTAPSLLLRWLQKYFVEEKLMGSHCQYQPIQPISVFFPQQFI